MAGLGDEGQRKGAAREAASREGSSTTLNYTAAGGRRGERRPRGAARQPCGAARGSSSGSDAASASDAAEPPVDAQALQQLTADLTEKVKAFNAGEKGSSRRIKRFMVMTEPPSIDAGEITDKGYVNQRCVIDRRDDLVRGLFSEPPAPGVITA